MIELAIVLAIAIPCGVAYTAFTRWLDRVHPAPAEYPTGDELLARLDAYKVETDRRLDDLNGKLTFKQTRLRE